MTYDMECSSSYAWFDDGMFEECIEHSRKDSGYSVLFNITGGSISEDDLEEVYEGLEELADFIFDSLDSVPEEDQKLFDRMAEYLEWEFSRNAPMHSVDFYVGVGVFKTTCTIG